MLHIKKSELFVLNCCSGIVPITCEELFKGIEEKKDSGTEFQVVLNMLEIYNEQVSKITLTVCPNFH